MKKILASFLISLLAVFSITAIAGTKMDASAEKIKNEQMKKDGEVIAFLIVLNNNEINAAKVIKGKKTDPAANYANMMIKDHSKNLQQTMALSHQFGTKPVNTDDVKSLQKDGDKLVKKLRADKAKDVNKDYMDAMVSDHKAALDLIDDKLLKKAQNAELKKHVENTRTAVDQHLQAAKDIQAKM